MQVLPIGLTYRAFRFAPLRSALPSSIRMPYKSPGHASLISHNLPLLRSVPLRLDTLSSAPLDSLGFAGLPLSLRLLLQCSFGAQWVCLASVG